MLWPLSEPDGKQRVAAFFDVDGTLLRVQSGTLYIGYLRRRGLMDLSDVVRIYWAYVTYRLGILNIRSLSSVTSRWLRGRLESEVAEHCRDWYESEVRHYFRPHVVEKVREHQRAGHVVALLTGGTRYLNDLIAAELGIEHVVASQLEVVDGRFTGRAILPLCYGEGKLVHARRFAEEQGLRLEDSYFYTDSITDLSVLERVAFPRPVAPDPRLRMEARQRGWPVIEGSERGSRRAA